LAHGVRLQQMACGEPSRPENDGAPGWSGEGHAIAPFF
jgi:hypothetical protein